jgi:hypothetical protein
MANVANAANVASGVFRQAADKETERAFQFQTAA